MAKEILIPETSFIGRNEGDCYQYSIDDIFFSNESVFVKFDGVKYECDLIDGTPVPSYGAPYDEQNDTYDFSDYPFAIEIEGTSVFEQARATIYVQDGNEHTIEVYVGEEGEQILHQHSNVRTQDNQIFYFDENTGDFIFFDGDSWGQNNDAWGKGIVPPKSKVAVVGTAIVGTDVVGESSSETALVDSAIVDTDVVGEEEEPQEVVLIPETTFTIVGGEFGAFYEFDGIVPFKYTQVKIIYDGEEIIADGFAGLGGNIGYRISENEVLSCNETQNIVSYEYEDNTSSSLAHTIKVIKITDEEILVALPGGTL